jgi:hypothetical protein
MGREAIRLLKFAIRYQGGWHSYNTDQKTVRAVRRLVTLGFLEVNHECRQFRLVTAAC